MRLHRTIQGVFVEQYEQLFLVPSSDWDELLCDPALTERLHHAVSGTPRPLNMTALLSPVQSQEVWAAGVTYYRSRDARIEESKAAGGGDFYDRIYTAPRPELFFKSSGNKVIGPGAPVRIRSDASWSVPEPELTLVINPRGNIIGYTIGNDMSSRDIEGLNPLYLPQAKIYDGSCAIGPGILLSSNPMPSGTEIKLEIFRADRLAFSEKTSLASLKRDPQELVEYLYRENSFPYGAFLMTGTGIVPPDSFSLASGDIIRISIDDIGTLENPVA
jgi:2-dehydro-3-deoxy-D-arabinonate dehydratase